MGSSYGVRMSLWISSTSTRDIAVQLLWPKHINPWFLTFFHLLHIPHHYTQYQQILVPLPPKSSQVSPLLSISTAVFWSKLSFYPSWTNVLPSRAHWNDALRSWIPCPYCDLWEQEEAWLPSKVNPRWDRLAVNRANLDWPTVKLDHEQEVRKASLELNAI